MLLDYQTLNTTNIGGVLQVGIAHQEEVLSITADVIVMKPGKRFRKVYVTENQNIHTFEDATEADITGFTQKLAFKSPGLNDTLSEISRTIGTGKYILLWREAGECSTAKWFYMGNPTCEGAYRSKNSGGTGTTKKDYKGHEFEFTLDGAAAPYSQVRNSDAMLLFGIPSPPILGASAITTTSFKVNWVAVAGAAGYRLDVSTSNTFATFVAGYENLAIAGGSVTEQSVTSLISGTPYFYRLRTVDANGQVSVNSNVYSQSTN